jgi:DNA (cytosine-5)-methyltransferase 1
VRNLRIRRFTPRELERCQGLPDDWTKRGAGGAEFKDTPRYAMIGNALAVPCAEMIMRGIARVLTMRET